MVEEVGADEELLPCSSPLIPSRPWSVEEEVVVEYMKPVGRSWPEPLMLLLLLLPTASGTVELRKLESGRGSVKF